MPARRVLILGGTRDARALASALLAEGCDVTTSLAGVTENPVLPEGRVRRGGFGGPEGLQSFLAGENIAAVVDATHPFAVQMSHHASEACDAAGVSLLRLERPAWKPEAGDLWQDASNVAEAASMLPPGARVFVTIGRKEIRPFLGRPDLGGVLRMIEPPALEVPPAWRVLLQRPPFTVESETQLITHDDITHVVTKNAGGDDTSAKLVAARRLRLPVIMIARPAKPQVPSFPAVKEIILMLRQALLP